MPDENSNRITWDLRTCLVSAWPEEKYLETQFLDGTKVPLQIIKNWPEYQKRARDLGYGDNAWRMCLHFELARTVFSQRHGLQFSHTLWDKAHGRIPNETFTAMEEAEINDFLKKLTAAGG